MADIMIDNWTLQRAAISINDTYEKISSPNEEYVKLIEALVLWDHVYFIDNEYSQYWKKFLYRFGYEKYLSPFAIPKEENISVHSLGDIENSIISEKALMYSTFCNKHNISYAYVGERRAFDKVESIIYDTAGQPHTKSFVEENGIPSNNPTNSKKVQKKSHYDDDAWIIRTAISQYENDDGVYSDIYEVVGNISEKMP